jgi:hypothetical protein
VQKNIAKGILIVGIAMMAGLWAPVWAAVHLYSDARLNIGLAVAGSLAMASCLWLLGSTAGRYQRMRWALLSMAVVIAGGSAWVPGTYLAAAYAGPMAKLLGGWWWPTSCLMSILSELSVVGSGLVLSIIEAEEEHHDDLEKQLEEAELGRSRAEKEAKELREALAAAQLAGATRGHRETHASAALAVLQDDGGWLSVDDIAGAVNRQPNQVAGPLGRKLLEAGSVARLRAPEGHWLYAAKSGGEAPPPPVHVLPFREASEAGP